MSQLASYKRYWEPNLAQVLGVSLPVGAFVTLVTQPLEFVKTRVQVRVEGVGLQMKNQWLGINPHKVFREIHETGVGLRGFYYGAEAALLSRVGYLFLRNFLFKTMYDSVKPVKPTNDLSNKEKGVVSGVAGGVAALLTTPFELVMTRQIADGGLPAFARRNYTGFFDAYPRIMAEEGGYQALFKGGFANVLRAVVMNATLTANYDSLREKLWVTFGDFAFIDPIATFYAAAFGTAFTLPIDNIKTRLQRAHVNPQFNRLNYQGFLNAFGQVLQVEGFLSLYAGAFPYYAKMLITCFLTTTLTDKITIRWKKQAGLQEWQL